jgi:hypothetical protein
MAYVSGLQCFTGYGEKRRDMECHMEYQWAFQGERTIHAKPSGIDNSVRTFGMLYEID